MPFWRPCAKLDMAICRAFRGRDAEAAGWSAMARGGDYPGGKASRQCLRWTGAVHREVAFDVEEPAMIGRATDDVNGDVRLAAGGGGASAALRALRPGVRVALRCAASAVRACRRCGHARALVGEGAYLGVRLGLCVRRRGEAVGQPPVVLTLARGMQTTVLWRR